MHTPFIPLLLGILSTHCSTWCYSVVSSLLPCYLPVTYSPIHSHLITGLLATSLVFLFNLTTTSTPPNNQKILQSAHQADSAEKQFQVDNQTKERLSTLGISCLLFADAALTCKVFSPVSASFQITSICSILLLVYSCGFLTTYIACTIFIWTFLKPHNCWKSGR